MKKIFQLILTMALVASLGACTSKKVEETPDATAEMTGDEISESDVSEEDFGSEESTAEGETEVAESPEATESAPSGEATESDMEGLADTTTPEEAPVETTPDTASDMTSETPTSDSSDMEGLSAQETPTEESVPSDSGSDSLADTSSYTNEAPTEEPPAPKAMIPLRKVETTPWTQAGVLLNAVYVARPGDTFESVSQKIYGDASRVDEMKKVNPTIARREMKVGDKVYYNSPRRPADNTQLITFYEDSGLAPETYVSQPGDNIRAVSQKLLGDSNSWKEIWATNMDVESKGDLPEGTSLRYWSAEVAAPAAPVVAEQPPVEPEVPQETPVAGTVANNDIPPPPSENAMPLPEEVPPPPSEAPVAAAPPVQESLPPEPMIAEAPPAPMDATLNQPVEHNPLADLLGGEDQTTALMIGALFLIAAAALFIIIRKRKARKNIDFQTATHTQIE